MYEKIKYRYQMGYVTDEQLLKYAKLGVITMAQAREIQASKEV